MIFGINTTCDISKLSQISSRHYYFEISLMVFMPKYHYKSCYYQAIQMFQNAFVLMLIQKLLEF